MQGRINLIFFMFAFINIDEKAMAVNLAGNQR